MKVWTQAGLKSRENRLFKPARAPDNPEDRDGDGDRELSGDDGGESGGAGSLELDRAFRVRPASSMYGVIEDDLLLPIFLAIASFSSISISTSFISSPTPSSGLMARPSLSILRPKTRKSIAAIKFVSFAGSRVGTACPSTADKTVITVKAAKAAENTNRGGCFMAISAATKNVLSPISENNIIVKDRRKECNGWIKVEESTTDVDPVDGGVLTLRGSSLEELTGTG